MNLTWMTVSFTLLAGNVWVSNVLFRRLRVLRSEALAPGDIGFERAGWRGLHREAEVRVLSNSFLVSKEQAVKCRLREVVT